MRGIVPFVLLIAVATTGCGRPDWGEFNPYVDAFLVDADAHHARLYEPAGLEIEFGDPGAGHWGYCHWKNSGESKITLRESSWRAADEDRKMAMLYHELGHCLLHQDHRPPDLKHYPNSIMLPDSVGGYLFHDYREWFVDELFEGDDSGLSDPSPPSFLLTKLDEQG